MLRLIGSTVFFGILRYIVQYETHILLINMNIPAQKYLSSTEIIDKLFEVVFVA